MSNPARTVQVTWFTMMTLQTIGSVDAQRKLPAPKQFAAISVVWGILFLMADTGAGKLAARLSLLILLTAAVLGPFGTRMIQFLEMISTRFATAPPAPDPGQQGMGVSPINPQAQTA